MFSKNAGLGHQGDGQTHVRYTSLDQCQNNQGDDLVLFTVSTKSFVVHTASLFLMDTENDPSGVCPSSGDDTLHCWKGTILRPAESPQKGMQVHKILNIAES